MTAVVDLATVARVRTELAALVVAHPELTQPAARERLAAALPDLMELPMSRPLDPNHTKGTTARTVGVRMDPYLWAIVDAEVARLDALVPGATFSASDAVRSLIRRASTMSATPVAVAPATPVAVPAEPPLVVSPSMLPRRATVPPARASVRPPLPSVPPPPRVPAELVETEAARVDPRQLALIAEPPADLDGMTVRVMPLETVAEVRARIAALQAANPKLSNRKIGSLAGLSNAPVDKIMRGGNVRPETLAMIVAALPHG